MVSTCYITRRETFNAAHKLWREDWSLEKTKPFLENAVIKIGMVTTSRYL